MAGAQPTQTSSQTTPALITLHSHLRRLHPITHTDCDVCTAITNFSQRLDIAISELSSPTPSPLFTQHMQDGTLSECTTTLSFSTFLTPVDFHNWVHQLMLKHPYRLLPSEALFTSACITLSPDESYESAFKTSDAFFQKWKHYIFLPENLDHDQDQLWIFGVSFKKLTLEQAAEKAEDRCTLCTEAFVPAVATWKRLACGHVHKTPAHYPTGLPCGHIFGYTCLEEWRRRAPLSPLSPGDRYDTYRLPCPLCRACAVCGRQNCTIHQLKRELDTPIPLLTFLRPIRDERAEPGKTRDEDLGQLKGWPRAIFHEVKQETREVRVMISYMARYLYISGASEEGPAWESMAKELDEIIDGLDALLREREKEIVSKRIGGGKE
ncbi:hypothetical protein CC80DRAFT_506111 [Byssothecium circinans]|uniref:RING-type domain-containing protein n=1 Tax=Byssothecium circinans TaxID=147558 RepID=A0A6A5TQB1_9PLEO|nr:hypothetical protein CC80DRAFT_506111 [Byssothecium circinans]